MNPETTNAQKKFRLHTYADILWMEDKGSAQGHARDFRVKDERAEDDGQYSRDFTLEDVARFIPEEYQFRLRPCKSVIETIKQLDDSFAQYSCAILDVNMENDLIQSEYTTIKEKLEKKFVMVPEREEDFWRNAGFYIYLYLVHLGMPADRIAILTGNNTTAQEDQFRLHGIKPPKKIDKGEGEQGVREWLQEILDTPHRLRSCMTIMSRYVLDALNVCEEKTAWRGAAFESADYELENAKMMLESLQDISLRIPQEDSEAGVFFKSLIWQIVQPWEATRKDPPWGRIPCAYWTTLRTARNWMAHDVIQGFKRLPTVAFLFGLGLRGMFNLHALFDTNKLAEYEQWEDELLAVVHGLLFLPSHNCEEEEADKKIRELCVIVMRSYYEFHRRAGSLRNGEITKDIGHLIFEIGQKNNKIPCYEQDFVRAFLHGIVTLFFKWPHNTETETLRFMMSIDLSNRGQYYNYWCHENRYYLTDKDGIRVQGKDENYIFVDVNPNDVNTYREWDYVEAILDIVKEALREISLLRK